MANYGYTIVYPTAADVNALATQLAQRQSDSGPNAGIADNGNRALGQLAQGGLNDPAGVGTAFFQAMADAILCAVGFQLESNNSINGASATSTSYVDVAGSSITFTAPIARVYTVHCDTSIFFTAGTTPFANMRLVVNGNNGPDMNIQEPGTASGTYRQLHLMHAAACAAGSNTIKLQWKVQSGVTINGGTSSMANYIISG